MTQVYKASRKTIGKDGKTYWNNVGVTVFVSEYNGQPSVSIIDDRIGETWPCFPPKQRTLEAVPNTPAPTDGVPF